MAADFEDDDYYRAIVPAELAVTVQNYMLAQHINFGLWTPSTEQAKLGRWEAKWTQPCMFGRMLSGKAMKLEGSRLVLAVC